MIEFKQRFKLGIVDKMLLDAAHDAEAIYLLLDHQNIEPFIDLNNRSKKESGDAPNLVFVPKPSTVAPSTRIVQIIFVCFQKPFAALRSGN